MKRVLALILTIASMMSLLNCSAVHAEEKTLSQDQATLLTYLGVYDEDLALEETVSKAEFAKLLSKVAFGLNADPALYATGKGALDVDDTHDNYIEITALLSSGYISTNKFGYFQPDKDMDINTAYEFALRTMGYAETDLFKSGKFARLAAQKDLSDDLVGADGALTRINAYILIYNMLNTDVSDMMSLAYNISSNKEMLFRETKLKLFQTKGIVTDDGFTSMYGTSQVDKGYVVVENQTTLINNTGVDNLIGKNIVGYYTSTSKDEIALVLAYEREDKNSVYILRSPNILSYETGSSYNTYTYYDDEFSLKTKKTKIAKNATVIYNEKTVKITDVFETSKRVPQNGIIRLYDNNGDGTIDVVRIEDYEASVISAMDLDNGKIYLKNGTEIILSDNVTVNVFDAEGKETKVADLQKGNVVSVLKSLDGENYKMVVSTRQETAVVKACVKSTTNTRGYILTEEGGKYVFSKYLEEVYGAPQLSYTYKFKFDAFDRIVDIEKQEGTYDWMYTYLLWVRRVEDKAGDVFIRIFNEYGEQEVLEPANRVKVIFEDDTEKTLSPSQLADEVTYSGVIRYRQNSKGQVISIEIPKAFGTKPTDQDRLYCMIDTQTNQELVADYECSGSGAYRNYGGVAIFTENTKIVNVPADARAYGLYEMTGIASVGVETATPPVRAYRVGTKTTSIEYACLYETTSVKDIGRGVSWLKSKKLIYDETLDEEVYELTCASSTGSETKYYMTKENFETNVNAYAADANGNVVPVELNPGDAFYAGLKGKYIEAMSVIYDADRVVKDEQGNDLVGGIAGIDVSYYMTNNTRSNPFSASGSSESDFYQPGKTGNQNAWRYNPAVVKVFVGWVYSYENNILVMTNQNPKYGMDATKTIADGVAWESNVVTGSAGFCPDFSRTLNYANIQTGGHTKIKPYTEYGADCSRIVLTKRQRTVESIMIINPN